MTKYMRGVLAGLFAVAVGGAQAALVDRGGGLIYDDVLNITWLQDANYAKTSGFQGGTGQTYFTRAWNWAQGLVYVDSVRQVAWDDWRLPLQSELAFMYHENHIGVNLAGHGFPFIDLEPAPYWGWVPAQGYIADSTSLNFGTGSGGIINGEEHFYLWAVRVGDVGPIPVEIPEPGTLALLALGLAGLGYSRRK